MNYAEILQVRLSKVCEVIDSMELYKNDPSTLERFNQALNWDPEVAGGQAHDK